MVTRNWYNAIIVNAINWTNCQFRNVTGTWSTWSVSQAQVATRVGHSTNAYGVPSLYQVRTSLTSYGGVIFGDGDAPPTMADYKLSGNLITTITTSTTVSWDEDDITGTGSLKAEYTITNTGSSAITIREIGLIAAAGANNSYNTNKCLLERTVLDEPLTIPKGGTGRVTYVVECTIPYDTDRWDLP